MLSKSVRDQAHNIRAKRMEVRIDAIGLLAAAGCKANGGSPKGWGAANQVADRRCFVRGSKKHQPPNEIAPESAPQNCGHDVASDWLIPELVGRMGAMHATPRG